MSCTGTRLFTLLVSALLGLAGHPVRADDLAHLNRAKAIVTGTGETNRAIGFELCLDQVVVRLSGDQRLLAKPGMAALRARAPGLVASFSYRDRLEGIPIHDEQGSHDRPHDLTCDFDQAKLDAALAELDAKPWLDARPVVVPLLAVERSDRRFLLSADGSDGPFMDVSFAAAAEPLAMTIALPSKASLSGMDENSLWQADRATLDRLAKEAGGEVPLVGRLTWSDSELGWIAEWTLAVDGRPHRWQVRGVSFDEAFRVAMRGAAQVLSGNGSPG